MARVGRADNLTPDEMTDTSTDCPARTVVFNSIGCTGTMISRGDCDSDAQCMDGLRCLEAGAIDFCTPE